LIPHFIPEVGGKAEVKQIEEEVLERVSRWFPVKGFASVRLKLEYC
jgi:hypothetical protein